MLSTDSDEWDEFEEKWLGNNELKPFNVNSDEDCKYIKYYYKFDSGDDSYIRDFNPDFYCGLPREYLTQLDKYGKAVLDDCFRAEQVVKVGEITFSVIRLRAN